MQLEQQTDETDHHRLLLGRTFEAAPLRASTPNPPPRAHVAPSYAPHPQGEQTEDVGAHSDGEESELSCVTLPSTDEDERIRRRRRKDGRAGYLMVSGQGIPLGSPGGRGRNDEEQVYEEERNDYENDRGNDKQQHQEENEEDVMPFPAAQPPKPYRPRREESQFRRHKEEEPELPTTLIWQKPQALLASFLKADQAVKSAHPKRTTVRKPVEVEELEESAGEEEIVASGSKTGSDAEEEEERGNSELEEELPEVGEAMDGALSKRRRQGQTKQKSTTLASDDDNDEEGAPPQIPKRRAASRTIQTIRRPPRSSSVDSMDIPIPPKPQRGKAKGKGKAKANPGKKRRKDETESSSSVELPKRRPRLGKRAVAPEKEKDQPYSSGGESDEGYVNLFFSPPLLVLVPPFNWNHLFSPAPPRKEKDENGKGTRWSRNRGLRTSGRSFRGTLCQSWIR